MPILGKYQGALLTVALSLCAPLAAEELPGEGRTRLLSQPTLSQNEIAFVYAADIWVASRRGGLARRLTSTAAVESDPHFSPNGLYIAFSSNRSGNSDVYIVPAGGGTPRRLTWYPSPSFPRGWSPDGKQVLYASDRETAPSDHARLWAIAANGEGPSTLLPAPWGFDAAWSPDGNRLAVDRVDRWDVEWRSYRGGQNTPITLLDLETLEEKRLPNERSTDRDPVWLDDTVYFLSDRDWATNVWAYRPADGELRQITREKDADLKALTGRGRILAYEQLGDLYLYDLDANTSQRLDIVVQGDFPWAEPQWFDAGKRIAAASLSPTGKRALFEARGEIFTVPAEKGNARNLTRSSGAADRAPVWSPDGKSVAWVSDVGGEYQWMIAAQDGTTFGQERRIPLGESKMVWEPAWSPDGKKIAFVDNEVRVRLLDVKSGKIDTIDVGGVNLERGAMGPVWSPDSQWLAYAKTQPNQLRQITVWSRKDGKVRPFSDPMADAMTPAWDRGGRYLYFLASTEIALGSGWANTSSMKVRPRFGVYAAVLRADDPTPLALQSDEEAAEEEAGEPEDPKGGAAAKGDEGKGKDAEGQDKKRAKDKKAKGDEAEDEDESIPAVEVKIDFEHLERRIVPLPLEQERYIGTLAGPEGSLFVAELEGEGDTVQLHKFVLEERETTEFLGGAGRVAISADGKKLLYESGESWAVVDTEAPPEPGKGQVKLDLRIWLDRQAEWRQIFEEAWRYQRDYFYDPAMHGNDWQAVYQRYAPLVRYVRHRRDLLTLLDQVNGELSVGHSFVFGGDLPEVPKNTVGLLGADFALDQGRWKITRIYTHESWNPQLKAPLALAGAKVAEGQWLLAINGVPLTAADDPYRLLDGTAGVQIPLRLNDKPTDAGAWTLTVEPIASEKTLRRRAWVEDNRRRVEKLSGGKLAYVWVPDTGDSGLESFDRYFFAQQDKDGAVIDERFNGGGFLDDYMVDLMTRKLRAAVTNEVAGGRHFRLPAGILGPKVLLINEQAGSGGDFFPWIFRRLQAGPLIGTRTWGGLVKSSVHYALIDRGALTAPDNAVFDPAAKAWIGENEGIPPDIEVLNDAKSVAAGRDPQLERAVQEALRLLEANPLPAVEPPPYSRPSKRPGV